MELEIRDPRRSWRTMTMPDPNLERSGPTGEPGYAPASERVPVDPVPSHRNLTDHTDTHTPEREAAGHTPSVSTEPSFTRVTRPSGVPTSPSYGTYNDATWNSEAPSRGVPFGLG